MSFEEKLFRNSCIRSVEKRPQTFRDGVFSGEFIYF